MGRTRVVHEAEDVGAALVGHAVGESLRAPAPSVSQIMGPTPTQSER